MNKDNFLDELFARTDLVQLIGEYVQLTKKGSLYWGCCPFHNEKTPSFSVSGDRQLYYCHGACKEGGNAITFIKKIESVEGRDAVRILAKKVGLEVPDYTPKNDSLPKENKDRLFSLMREAARHYHNNLVNTQDGKNALNYLTRRSIDAKLTSKFGLGYSVNGTNLVSHLTNLGYTIDELKLANVAQISENGTYDPFQYRLIIPIVNQFGEVCAFGGRSLQANPEFAKYRNSTNTPLFEKNKIIFAANLLQKLKKNKAKIEYVILCEGYMDVIALHKHGFNTAVASMGTALTFNQAKQIKNFTSKVFISFDGDTAGQKNTLTGLDILTSAGLSVRVVELPPGYDPDDVVTKNGTAAYQKLLDTALTLPEFKIKTLKKQYDLADPEGKANFAKEAVRVIVKLEDPTLQEEYLKRIHELTGYSLDALRRQADKVELGVEEPQANLIVPKTTLLEVTKLQKAQKFILSAMAADKKFVDYKEDFNSFLVDEFAKTIAFHFVANHKENTQSSAVLYSNIESEHHAYLDELLNATNFSEGDSEAHYKACILTLKTASLIEQKAQITTEWQQSKDTQLLIKLGELDAKIRSLTKGED